MNLDLYLLMGARLNIVRTFQELQQSLPFQV